MIKKIKLLSAFRYVGFSGIVLLGLVAIVGTGGVGGSKKYYLGNAEVIHEAPPPETISASAPAIFDLSFISSGGTSITFSVSFTDIEGDATTFCLAFDDQPNRYYAYDVENETFGQTDYRLSVTDTITASAEGTYCFTVFIQDKAGNTSNKLSGCFYIECDYEECYDDCRSGCDNGTMTIKGKLDRGPIDLSGNACAQREEDIVVGLFCNGYYIGLIIKEPDKMVSGMTFTVKPYAGDEIMPDDFPIVVERFKPEHWEQTASSGTFTVITFNENSLVATYELIMPDGGRLSGKIDIRSFEDFEQDIWGL